MSKEPFKRPIWDYCVQWFEPHTGPFSYLIGCDYFVVFEPDLEPELLTGLDLYKDEIFADDYVICQKNT